MDLNWGVNSGFAALNAGTANLRKTIEGIRAREDQEVEFQKQLSAAGKSADAFAQAVPGFLEEIGQSPEGWKNLSAREKATAQQGFMKALAARELVEELQGRKQARQENEAVGNALREFARPTRRAGSPMETAEHADTEALAGAGGRLRPEDLAEFGTRPASHDERLRAALSTPNLGGRGAVMLMRALEEYGGGGEQFQFDPQRDVVQLPQLPGQSFVRTSKGGGQLAESPEAISAAATARAKAQQDVRPKITAIAEPEIDAAGLNTGRYVLKYQGDPDEVARFVAEQNRKGNGEGANGTRALPMPKTKAELKKGQAYQTPRGVAVWDGQQFVQDAPPPAE